MSSAQFSDIDSPSIQIPLFLGSEQDTHGLLGDTPLSPLDRDASDLPELDIRRRVYPLDARRLTGEQIAVAFAMTSRRPEPFDEIARQVSEESAAGFSERWVLGYGHASVAEHAVVHLAVENISRLACDGLEDNRLASYTEKSSRYQVMESGYFHTPAELDTHPILRQEYQSACQRLFDVYQRLIDGCLEYLRGIYRQGGSEKEAAYNLRLRRIATDGCRSVLPASTLTNVGVTANARTLERAVSKLMSSELAEEREIGEDVREQGRNITPTLIKYADAIEYLKQRPGEQRKEATRLDSIGEQPAPPAGVRLVHWDAEAEVKLTAALLYQASGLDYAAVLEQTQSMPAERRHRIIADSLSGLSPHDPLPRETEVVEYTFEFLLDYGAFREFRRHRMQTYLPQPLTVVHGVRIPSVIIDAGLEGLFAEATGVAERTFHKIHDSLSPVVAQYVVTHAHNRRLISRLNLRECFHLFRLRTSKEAHESIREPMKEALRQAEEVHPQFFRHLQLRRN